MIKSISTTIIATFLALSISGCSDKEPQISEAVKQAKEDAKFGCTQESVAAPQWTCMPKADGSYAGVGIALKSAAGMGHMRRVALANGRSDLAQQIKSQVQDKVEVYTNTTGVAAGETVDAVATTVTKQIAEVDLEGSSGVNVWTAPSGALYMLVTVDKKSVNKQIKNNITSSYKNDNALYQEYKSKNALKELAKEFE